MTIRGGEIRLRKGRREGGSEKSKKSVRKEESQEIKKEERRVTDLFIKQFY